MKATARRTAVLVGLTTALLTGPLAVAAVAAPTATITLNGSSASASGSNVTVSGSAVTITAPGSYEIRGTLNNGYVAVDTAATGTVELILAGASITNTTSSPLYVLNAGAVTVTLAAGTSNSLTDATTYTSTGEPDSALFSAADLTIAGTGSLTVRANAADGIVSKDDLVIQSGTITVTAVDDAIRGKDSLTINGGTINVTSSGGDGIKSNETEAGKGVLTITNGTITASVADDAIKGENVLNISGGTINVPRSYEALEGLQTTISGGNINVVASDDAVNAAEEGLGHMQPSSIAFIRVTGGTVVATGGTDGFDSNGSLTFAGGTVAAKGSSTRGGGEGAIDADGPITFTSGTVVGAALTSLAVFRAVPNTGQGWVAPRFNSNLAANTIVHVVSGSTVLASYRASATTREVVFSSNRITNGQRYDIYTGGSVSGTSTGGLYTSGSITGATRVLTGVTAGQYGRF
ncbi:carbohydrate-binding domain-containing protein [Plantactinospora sp. S1510]|uniref:Carbohydrate-binding domain-containing protein n=1 Tax=Plantactinospora alkalitolerans TaxID=2789879 RepID=A0ABS0GQQ8_9ACTN|nr:carbohydrate-binding domain-containing protein [Plantactinospora alkalitolerans]MBF9128522.1 carbohydrate-binding domain-containing protein [Plantactinospora alkalitolerans]